MSVFDQDDPGFQVTLDRGMIISILGAITIICVLIFILGIVVGRNTINPQEQAALTVQNTNNKSPADKSAPEESRQITTDTQKSQREKTESHPQSKPLPTATAKPSSGQSFAVQVAFMSKQRDADKIVTKLSRLGYKNAYISIHEGERTGYRVRVGPYATRSDATNVWRKLKRQGYPQAWIVVN